VISKITNFGSCRLANQRMKFHRARPGNPLKR
jgi:hypothetical protein